jgi:hypothetical protein
MKEQKFRQRIFFALKMASAQASLMGSEYLKWLVSDDVKSEEAMSCLANLCEILNQHVIPTKNRWLMILKHIKYPDNLLIDDEEKTLYKNMLVEDLLSSQKLTTQWFSVLQSFDADKTDQLSGFKRTIVVSNMFSVQSAKKPRIHEAQNSDDDDQMIEENATQPPSELSQDHSETKEVKQVQAEKGADNDFQYLEMNIFPPMLNNNPQYNKLFVRPCYEDMFKLIVGRLQTGKKFNAMVTGNPGIGKSYFYIYVAIKLATDPSLLGSWKLMINSSTQFYLLQGDSFVYVEESALGPLVGNETVLRLVDGTTSPGRLSGWSGSTILFASPADVDSTNKPSTLMKNFEGNYLIMPVWNEEEIIFVNKILTSI